MFRRFFYHLLRSNDVIEYNEAIELQNNNKAILIDVKSEDEYNKFHIKNAINIPLNKIENNIDKIVKNKEKMIILYCETGKRAKAAKRLLKVKGYENVSIMYV